MLILSHSDETAQDKMWREIWGGGMLLTEITLFPFPAQGGFAADGDDLWVFKKRKIRSVVCVVGLGASEGLRDGQPGA